MTAPQGVVRTVLGDIPADSLGRTLIHEHLVCSLVPYWAPDFAPGAHHRTRGGPPTGAAGDDGRARLVPDGGSFIRAYDAGIFRSLSNREFIDFLESLEQMPWSHRSKAQGNGLAVPTGNDPFHTCPTTGSTGFSGDDFKNIYLGQGITQFGSDITMEVGMALSRLSFSAWLFLRSAQAWRSGAGAS